MSLFKGCAKLETVTIAEGITALSFCMFADCPSLREITIPASVTDIRGEAFSKCAGLHKVTIQSTRVQIRNDAFEDCPRLTSLIFTATTVENAYIDNLIDYDLLKDENADGDQPAYSSESILNTYVNYWDRFGGRFLIDTGSFRGSYVSGYLAVLYLSEMSASQDETLGSAMSVDGDGNTVVDSEKLRLELNGILEKLHNGETLDQIIADVSAGEYTGVDDYEARFIRGTGNQGDEGSLAFCATLLNYLEDLSVQEGTTVSGSILFDYGTPKLDIDTGRRVTSDVFKVDGKNDLVESDADVPAPYTDGGKYIAGGDVPDFESFPEYTEAMVNQEWMEKVEGVDNWTTMDAEEVVQRMLDLAFPSNIVKMAEAFQEREDCKEILGIVADEDMRFEVVFENHDIEYEEEDDWDIPWEDPDDLDGDALPLEDDEEPGEENEENQDAVPEEEGDQPAPEENLDAEEQPQDADSENEDEPTLEKASPEEEAAEESETDGDPTEEDPEVSQEPEENQNLEANL